MTGAADRPPARERLHALGEVPRDERAHLIRGFGAVLRLERGALTQAQLAERAGLTRVTVARLENGLRRPTTSSTWKLARALRPRATMRDRVALDQRLREAAGSSLRDYGRRPHVARERVRAELLAEAGAGPVASDSDSMSALIVAELVRPVDDDPRSPGW